MNKLFIYLKENKLTKTYDLYINGQTVNFYKKANTLVTPQAYLLSVQNIIQTNVLGAIKIPAPIVEFQYATIYAFNTWCTRFGIDNTQPIEVEIKGLSEDGKTLIDFNCKEVIREAILSASKEEFEEVQQTSWIVK